MNCVWTQSIGPYKFSNQRSSMSIKNTIARLLFIAFFSLSLITLTSCNLFGGGNTNQPKPLVKAPPSKQTYTLPETEVADFDTLDPALAHDIHSINAIQ